MPWAGPAAAPRPGRITVNDAVEVFVKGVATGVHYGVSLGGGAGGLTDLFDPSPFPSSGERALACTFYGTAT